MKDEFLRWKMTSYTENLTIRFAPYKVLAVVAHHFDFSNPSHDIELRYTPLSIYNQIRVLTFIKQSTIVICEIEKRKDND